MDLGGRHGGQARDDRTDRPIILHRWHVVVDLIGGHFAFVVDGNLHVGV